MDIGKEQMDLSVSESTPSAVGFKRTITPPSVRRLMMEQRLTKTSEEVAFVEETKIVSLRNVLAVVLVLALAVMGGGNWFLEEKVMVNNAGRLHEGAHLFEEYRNSKFERPTAIFVTEGDVGGGAWFKAGAEGKSRTTTKGAKSEEAKQFFVENKVSVPVVVRVKARSVVLYRVKEALRSSSFKGKVKEAAKLIGVGVSVSVLGKPGMVAKLVKFACSKSLLGRVNWIGLTTAAGGLVAGLVWPDSK